jgi:glycosyltransferase involved in cell wall biosynthesis
MDETPFISICIPAFQRITYLRRLLDSIEIQSFRDFETVISDDSPGSEVQELIQNHALKPKIRYFRNKETLGSPENWNEGIRNSRAGWIKIMHDDDWFSGPGSLLAFADAIRSKNARFYFSAYTNVEPDGKSGKIRINNFQLNVLKKLPESLMAANRIGPPSVVIFKKEDSLYFDRRMQWLVDIDFYIRYLKKYPTVEYIPQNLVQIGISASQVTRRSFGNPGIEIPERFLLGEKLNYSAIRHISVFDSWWRFMRNLSIRNLEQIKRSGYHGKIPEFITEMMMAQQKIPVTLLKRGVFSKIFMLLHYYRSSVIRHPLSK